MNTCCYCLNEKNVRMQLINHKPDGRKVESWYCNLECVYWSVKDVFNEGKDE